jgi:hypothetical protein
VLSTGKDIAGQTQSREHAAAIEEATEMLNAENTSATPRDWLTVAGQIERQTRCLRAFDLLNYFSSRKNCFTEVAMALGARRTAPWFRPSKDRYWALGSIWAWALAPL